MHEKSPKEMTTTIVSTAIMGREGNQSEEKARERGDKREMLTKKI